MVRTGEEAGGDSGGGLIVAAVPQDPSERAKFHYGFKENAVKIYLSLLEAHRREPVLHEMMRKLERMGSQHELRVLRVSWQGIRALMGLVWGRHTSADLAAAQRFSAGRAGDPRLDPVCRRGGGAVH